eukprot:Gb_29101 [translate_table: standard]
MGHTMMKSSRTCRATTSEQYGSINHGRIFSLDSSYNSIPTQLQQAKQSAQWPLDASYVIQRQMDLLSIQSPSGAGLLKCPKIKRVDGMNSSYDQTKEGLRQAQSREIELCSEPTLPYGWEQFLDIKTGEIYYIDWSCGKRARVDPCHILQDVEKNIQARMSSLFSKGCMPIPATGVDDNRSWKDFSNSIFQDDTAMGEQYCGSGIGLCQEECEDESELNLYTSSDESSEVHRWLEYSDVESSQPVKTNDDGGGGVIPVVKGCRQCLSYILLPRGILECPSCNNCLFEVDKFSSH